MTEPLRGMLEFYSETGTEGGYYSFQKLGPGFAHTWEEPCWDDPDTGCPTRQVWSKKGWPEKAGQRVSDLHCSYAGLVGLGNGDRLKIWNKDKSEVVWEGDVDMRTVDSWGPDGGTAGLRVHQKANNVDEVTWLTWFNQSLPAELTKKEST